MALNIQGGSFMSWYEETSKNNGNDNNNGSGRPEENNNEESNVTVTIKCQVIFKDFS